MITLSNSDQQKNKSAHSKEMHTFELFCVMINFENSYWTGLDHIELLAGKSFDYEITYHPLTMTSNVTNEDNQEDEEKVHYLKSWPV